MQIDFHYYATYCAAYLAGFSHAKSLEICSSAQLTDCCSVSYLSRAKAPRQGATTQEQTELMDARTDIPGLQEITRIWASFHFLPYDLYAEPKRRTSRQYLQKYRLICGPDGDLAVETVELAKGRSLQAAGIAMHVLADTWAHQYFAGTPSLVINNTDSHFYEIAAGPETGMRKQASESVEERQAGHGKKAGPETGLRKQAAKAGEENRDGHGKDGRPETGLRQPENQIRFRHNPASGDDLEENQYLGAFYRARENSVLNLGHARAGHLPDYSFMRYRYLPAWGEYTEVTKDNPSEYYCAFCQMIQALKYLRGAVPSFEKGVYDMQTAAPWEARIRGILEKRRPDASADWKAFGEELSGREIGDFDQEKFLQEYLSAGEEEKEDTFLGKFISAAMAHKSMVTNRIFISGNLLAGFSIDGREKGSGGIREYIRMLETARRERKNRRTGGTD